MPNTWITDLRHYLDDGGALPELPGPALNLALFHGSIAAWVTSGRQRRTNVACRRRPRGRRCGGEISAGFAPGGQRIEWHCPECGDNGVIAGWQDTLWDRRMVGGHGAVSGAEGA